MYSSTFQTHAPSTNTYVQSCFPEGKARTAPKHVPPHLEISCSSAGCMRWHAPETQPYTYGLKSPISPKCIPVSFPTRFPFTHSPHRRTQSSRVQMGTGRHPRSCNSLCVLAPSLPITFPLYLGQKVKADPIRNWYHSGNLRRLL